jgi:arginyl-tRNA synthetase
MAHQSAVQHLVDQVGGLTLDAVTKKYPQTHPEINPFDLYRAHLSNVLAEVSGVDPAIIYPAAQWTQGLDKGDFVLAVPALRVKGTKPDVLASEWAAKVRQPSPRIRVS